MHGHKKSVQKLNSETFSEKKNSFKKATIATSASKLNVYNNEKGATVLGASE